MINLKVVNKRTNKVQLFENIISLTKNNKTSAFDVKIANGKIRSFKFKKYDLIVVK